MDVTEASALPNSPLHSQLLGEQVGLTKIKCAGMKINLIHCSAQNCNESAQWQQENTSIVFCELHKQQMSFMSFKPLETNQRAVLAHCATNKIHGLASKYCNKCSSCLCLNCAFDHAVHGVVDIDSAHKEIANKLAIQLGDLEMRTMQAQLAVEKAHQMITAIQLVYHTWCLHIARKTLCWKNKPENTIIAYVLQQLNKKQNG